MNTPPQHPLPIGPLRAFEAVARLLNFSAAAQELNLSQPAVSRQIRSLEEMLGARLFVRGTRHVALSSAGATLLGATAPLVHRLDATVRQIRSARSRRHIALTTFASFASLWLLPRLTTFQAAHPDIDIRISASDAVADIETDPSFDLALRHCMAASAPAGSELMFDELVTPVASPAWLAANPIAEPADLARHTLVEEETPFASASYISWRRWLGRYGQPHLQPRRWITLNYTHQVIQAALAGQGVAMTHWAFIADLIERGELVEPFGAAGRIESPYAYWLVRWPARSEREELRLFEDWLLAEATPTREQIARARDSALALR